MSELAWDDETIEEVLEGTPEVVEEGAAQDLS
jgi:hypothetical protein